MKKYQIDLCASRTITIEADCEDTAERIARNEALRSLHGSDFTLEETGDIEEVDSE